MKRLLAVVILLCGSAMAQGFALPAGTSMCGLVNNSAICGNIGTTSDPGGATDITGLLPYTLSSGAGGVLKLTGNAGADATACQIILTGNYSGKVTIWLGGFTLTGRICANGNLFGGFELFGGTFTCSFTNSGSNAGCLRYEQNGGTFTAPFSLHNLTATNTIDPAAGGSDVFHLVLQPTNYTGGGYMGSIYSNTCNTSAGLNSGRMPCFNVIGASSGGTLFAWEAYNNLVTFNGSSGAPQGFVVFCFNSAVYIHNNHFLENQNGSSTDSGRAVVFDGDGGTNCSNKNIAAYNFVNASNNRFIRQRTSKNAVVHHNTIINFDSSLANARASTGIFHLGDQTNTTDETDANFLAYDNTMTIASGLAIFNRGSVASTGWTSRFIGNTVNCAGGGCAGGFFARAVGNTGSMTGATINLYNNTVSSSLGTNGCPVGAQSANNCSDSTGDVINVCNSGTSGGNGTKNTVSCP